MSFGKQEVQAADVKKIAFPPRTERFRNAFTYQFKDIPLYFPHRAYRSPRPADCVDIPVLYLADYHRDRLFLSHVTTRCCGRIQLYQFPNDSRLDGITACDLLRCTAGDRECQNHKVRSNIKQRQSNRNGKTVLSAFFISVSGI